MLTHNLSGHLIKQLDSSSRAVRVQQALLRYLFDQSPRPQSGEARRGPHPEQTSTNLG